MGEAACEAAAAAGGSSSSTSVVADDAISAVAMDESLASVRTVLGELLDFVLVTFGYWYAYPEGMFMLERWLRLSVSIR